MYTLRRLSRVNGFIEPGGVKRCPNNNNLRQMAKNGQRSFSFRIFFIYLHKNWRTVIMKNKFEIEENGSMLGATIQQVRKAKGLTQEELGKRVGLPKSSICKIEKGQTHISFEEASLLMDAMGEKISIQVMGMMEPDEKKVERVRFVTIGVMWYAHSKKMAFADAYRYLLVYKGIQFLEENYAYEQTLPRETLLSDLDKVCNKNREKFRRAV